MLIADRMLGEKGIHQKLYKFDNGFGASVVIDRNIKTIGSFQYSGTYGGEKGLYELAVISFEETGNYIDDEYFYNLCYTTDITDDVIGYLTEKEVDKYLKKISKLNKE